MSEKSTIIIPTFNNCQYLKFCIDSIRKNSFYNHEIIIHLNGIDDKSESYLLDNKIPFTKTKNNVGLCTGVNLASKKSTTNFIIYAHDDMYFLPKWDVHLFNEVNNIKHNSFYLSMTQLSHTLGIKGNLQHIHYDCGSKLENFNEDKLLKNYDKFEFRNLQGSHWAPHIIHKDLWDKIGGFSEEFNPGFASDPDLNMKLWNQGVRIFKGVSLSRVYHFGSLTTRKNKQVVPNKGKKTFLLKWKFTVEFFTKHYLKRGSAYDGPLKNPEKNSSYYIDLFFVKFKYYINVIICLIKKS
jgi:glycosyltransferase involved in cell wall biosynthesis